MTTLEQLALNKYPPLFSYPTQDCEYNRMQKARREAWIEAQKENYCLMRCDGYSREEADDRDNGQFGVGA